MFCLVKQHRILINTNVNIVSLHAQLATRPWHQFSQSLGGGVQSR